MSKQCDLEKRLQELEALRSKGVLNQEEYEARRKAIIENTGEREVRVKKGFPIFRVGCLGIIGLVVLIVVIAAATSGGGGGGDSAGGDVHVALAANSSGTIAPQGNGDKQSKVTILKIANPATSTNQYEKPATGKKWVGFEVVVENVGKKEVTSLDWKLHDTKDFESGQTFVSGAGDSMDIYSDLTPGGKKQGWVFFEIDADAGPKWLRADPNPFLKNDLYFDAQ